MPIKCKNCSELVPSHRRECPACGEDNGFPNVRQAASTDETTALYKRVQDAQISAVARSIGADLDRFLDAIRRSKGIVSRPLTDLQLLIRGEHFSYASFSKQVLAGVRDPLDNEFDKTRVQFENALFPNYSTQIVFGSISLRERGISGYGSYDIVLKDKMIENRASVFEENPYNFAIKHHINLAGVIPPGYRAVWADRHLLSGAKLHSSIKSRMTVLEFAQILQDDRGGTADSDFVELHVFGTINLKTIEKVIGSKPHSREDKFLWRIIARDLKAAGIEAVTV